MMYTTFLIDLDETVYPSASGVWPAISARIEQYMRERLGLPAAEVPALRTQMFQQYGTTLHGLQVVYHVDERDYLDFVHDVPLERMLSPDPELRQVLQCYPQQKLVFTNADRSHAGRVIQRLQLGDCFNGIIDIYDLAPYCKPMPEAFQAALRLAGNPAPEQCVFIDDSPRNLAGARALGFYTIQVGLPKADYAHPTAQAHAQIARLSDLPRVLALS